MDVSGNRRHDLFYAVRRNHVPTCVKPKHEQSQYKSFPSFLEAKLRQRPSDAHKVSQPYGNLTQRRILEADTDGYSLSQSHMKMLVRFRIWYHRIIGTNRTSLLFDLFCIFLLVVKRSCKEQQVLHFLLQHWAAAEVLPDYSLSAHTTVLNSDSDSALRRT